MLKFDYKDEPIKNTWAPSMNKLCIFSTSMVVRRWDYKIQSLRNVSRFGRRKDKTWQIEKYVLRKRSSKFIKLPRLTLQNNLPTGGTK